jgi:Raf kinase inhibitor-like YbhB/YbcL family protein
MNILNFSWFIFLVLSFTFFNNSDLTDIKATKMEIKIESRDFKEGESIPSKYTCEGLNISPQLSWTCETVGVKTYVLIVEDPDAPRGIFTHWIVYNIPSRVNSLMENSTPTKNVPDEILMGVNDFGRIGYGGPCPPSGSHRYFFRMYGLDTAVHLDSGATKKEVTKKMEGHIIARGELMGTYQKQK